MTREDRIDNLSTTAYAVLGLLALSSWTGYELKQQAQRSLRFCLPKADSILYAQPRKLEALGLARSEVEELNGRRRNRYWITEEGRGALRRWLATPSGEPRLEFEPLLRLLLLDQDTLEGAGNAVDTMRRFGVESGLEGLAVLDTLGTEDEPFPERRPLKLLTALFHLRFGRAILDAVEVAATELDRWEQSGQPDVSTELEDDVEHAARELRRALERAQARTPTT